ncbi:MAG: aminopeptidase, partial [bacterium]|nr:aminopeptidase [bacterium]
MNLAALSTRFSINSLMRLRSPKTVGSPEAISTLVFVSTNSPVDRSIASRTNSPKGICSGGLTKRPTRESSSSSSSKQLIFLPPGEKKLMSRINGSIFLYAPESITHLSDIDPKKIGKTAVAQKALRDIANQREARGAFSWT